MELEPDLAGLELLRKPFPDGTVGKLPKPYKRDSQKGNCPECGTWHGLPAAHLDFVGHAAVTDRLLTVDPGWTWEPCAYDEQGLPAVDREGNLWIWLTVCGVRRLGVGDGPSMKERIGDAIRNAAMRFGVALSLWTRDELESGHAEDKPELPTSAASNLQKMEDPYEAGKKRRPPPQVTEISPKRRLLQVCGGDTRMATRLWNEAIGDDPEGATTLTDTEVALLLSRAEAEMEKGVNEPA